jgi:hypothetical protein
MRDREQRNAGECLRGGRVKPELHCFRQDRPRPPRLPNRGQRAFTQPSADIVDKAALARFQEIVEPAPTGHSQPNAAVASRHLGNDRLLFRQWLIFLDCGCRFNPTRWRMCLITRSRLNRLAPQCPVVVFPVLLRVWTFGFDGHLGEIVFFRGRISMPDRHARGRGRRIGLLHRARLTASQRLEACAPRYRRDPRPIATFLLRSRDRLDALSLDGIQHAGDLPVAICVEGTPANPGELPAAPFENSLTCHVRIVTFRTVPDRRYPSMPLFTRNSSVRAAAPQSSITDLKSP